MSISIFEITNGYLVTQLYPTVFLVVSQLCYNQTCLEEFCNSRMHVKFLSLKNRFFVAAFSVSERENCMLHKISSLIIFYKENQEI